MNRKHPLYKEKIKVDKEICELWKIQRTNNWVELEKPYKDGYYKFSDLRDDIKNRADAWVFYECLSLVGHRVWCKDKSFKRKTGKGKYEFLYPGFGEISEDVYEGLAPAVKKHFAEVGPYSKRWSPFRKHYSCIVPSYYFVDKIKPRWVTHYQEFDSVIKREEDEKEDYLRQEKFWPLCGWRGHSGAPKSFRKSFTRSDRRNSKQTVHKNIISGGDYDTYEYRYGHKHSARWYYW